MDTFSGWVEVFPTTKKELFLHEIVPHFEIPPSLQSDNGLEFISQFSQTLSKALNIVWSFHISYHPQSSGKIERTNQSLKNILVKLLHELHHDWVKLLILALFRLRALPKKPLSISPFELMCGRPVLTPGLSAKSLPLPDHLLTPLLCHLRSLLWVFTDHYLPRPYTNPCPSFINIGGQVLLSPPKFPNSFF